MSFKHKVKINWSTIFGALSFGAMVPTFFLPIELWTHEHAISIVVATLTAFVIWEGSKLIQSVVLYYFPWEKSIGKHLGMEVLLIFLFSSLILIAGVLIYGQMASSIEITFRILIRNNIVAFILALLFIGFNESAFLFNKWKDSLLEQERLKEESLKARLEGLMQQMDPHFLFNSLSVLSGVVYKDPVLADDYITRLSRVYRYSLEHKEETTIPLEKELNFAETYFFLMKVRFGEAIKMDLKRPKDETQLFVPTFSIQLLIENAIKHNQITLEHPLNISVAVENNYLVVKNNLTPRKASEGTKVGLHNLKTRFQYLTDKEVLIEKTDDTFKVSLPLIHTR